MRRQLKGFFSLFEFEFQFEFQFQSVLSFRCRTADGFRFGYFGWRTATTTTTTTTGAGQLITSGAGRMLTSAKLDDSSTSTFGGTRAACSPLPVTRAATVVRVLGRRSKSSSAEWATLVRRWPIGVRANHVTRAHKLARASESATNANCSSAANRRQFALITARRTGRCLAWFGLTSLSRRRRRRQIH